MATFPCKKTLFFATKKVKNYGSGIIVHKINYSIYLQWEKWRKDIKYSHGNVLWIYELISNAN